MTEQVAWRPGDLSPDARRAAEAAAEAEGVPLGDWLAETVRAAILRELGSIPTEASEPTAVLTADGREPELEPVEPAAEALEAERPAPEVSNAGVEPDLPPPTPPRQEIASEPAGPARKAPVIRAYSLPLDAQRLADRGLASWLATRIEGFSTATKPVAPSGAKAAVPPAADAHPLPRPQLDLFSAERASEPAPLSPNAPTQTIIPLSLPSGPVMTLAVAALRPARIRSRRSEGVDAAVPALAASVADHGVREPILVRRVAEDAGHYEVVAGERRRLAAERAGRADLPAVVVEAAGDAEAMMLSLAENLGRGDFSPLDEGRAYLRLLTEYRVSPAVLAQRLARERSHIVMALRLLGLPETVRSAIDGGQLAPAQAFALLGAPDPEALLEQMIQAAAGRQSA